MIYIISKVFKGRALLVSVLSLTMDPLFPGLLTYNLIAMSPSCSHTPQYYVRSPIPQRHRNTHQSLALQLATFQMKFIFGEPSTKKDHPFPSANSVSHG